jgi:hypothetical protein
MSLHAPLARSTVRRVLASSTCALALAGALCTGAHGDDSSTPPVPSPATPTPGTVSTAVEQCLTSSLQAARSVTFTGEMTAIPGSARMSMRIDLEERAPGEAEFHIVNAGLGMWRPSDAKVKVYKYLKQVGNLSAPGSYRGLVRFRWMNAKGHVIKRAERPTAHCVQPAPAPEAMAPTTNPPTTEGQSPTPPAPSA